MKNLTTKYDYYSYIDRVSVARVLLTDVLENHPVGQNDFSYEIGQIRSILANIELKTNAKYKDQV